MKKFFPVVFIAAALFFIVPMDAYAQRGCSSKCGSKKKKECPSAVIMKKAHFILENAEDLSLTDEQKVKVKNLKIDTKKEMIRRRSSIELVAVDIKSRMYDDPIDTSALDELIEKKYDLKKGRAKYLVGVMANLKSVLTQEQKDKMKNLKKWCREHGCH